MEKRLTVLTKRLTAARAAQTVLKRTLRSNQDAKDTALARQKDIACAREIIVLVGKEIQQALEFQISNLVTLALATVFPDPYEFIVAFEERRNTIEADLLFKRGNDVFTPIESSGGGAIDITSFALRVADWRLRGGRNVIILDEPFRNLSSDLQGKASALLKRISSELNLQIIMVSHHPKINEAADRTFYVNKGVVSIQS